MQELTISKKQSGKKISRILIAYYPSMPENALHKAFRKKDIKVSGKRITEDYIVSEGNVVNVYISDDILNGKPLSYDSDLNPHFSVVYEDENLLVVNKKQGVPVQPDKDQSKNSLIDLVRDYIENSKYQKDEDSSFVPTLCHRIDRNTGGLVIIAKNDESMKILLEKMKTREIRKFYQCLVRGKMPIKEDTLKAFLFKDEKKSMVFVGDKHSKGTVEIITNYRVMSFRNDISRLDVELVTGRTHQIRAHLAYIGHPIVGDGKYGDNNFNRSLNAKFQALWAYKIIFDFKEDAGILNYLNKKELEVEPSFYDFSLPEQK